jgi:V8-like Glu-specific endopeptidase
MDMPSSDEIREQVLLLYLYSVTLNTLIESGDTYGTGFLVNFPDSGRDCIMTAGHNIFNPDNGRLEAFRILKFTKNPAADKKYVGDVPQGSLWVSEDWKARIDHDRRDDYGLVVLDAQGSKIGGAGFNVCISDDWLRERGRELLLQGHRSGGENVERSSASVDYVEPRRISYNSDSATGLSGSPISVSYKNMPTVIGIQ